MTNIGAGSFSSSIQVSGLHLDKNYHLYYSGYFTDSTDFNPGLPIDIHTSNGNSDLSKPF